MQPFGIIGFIGNAQREIDTILQQLHNLEFLTEYHLYNIGDLSNNLPGIRSDRLRDRKSVV